MTPTLKPQVDFDSDPEFVLVDGVPILDEHELHLPAENGKAAQVLRIDAAKLAEIAGNNNRRVRETGDTVMLTEGHTSDDPDAADPEVVGEADKFWVAPLFNTGRQALFARFKFRKTADVLRKLKAGKFGRRSVELWTDRWETDPIALLGASAPERDLGVLRLHRMGGKRRFQGGRLLYEVCRVTVPVRYGCFQYGAGTEMSPTTPPVNGQVPATPPPTAAPGAPQAAAQLVDPNLMQAVMTGLESSDVWQQLQAQLAQIQQLMPMIQQLVAALGPMMGGPPGAMPAPGGMGPGSPAAGAPGTGGQMDPLMMLMAQMQGGGMPGMGGEERGEEGGEEGPPRGEEGGDDDRVRMEAAAAGFSTPTATNGFMPGMIPGLTPNRRLPQPPRHPAMNYQHNGATQPVVPQQQPVPPVPVVPQETPQQVIVRLQRQIHDLQQQNQLLQVTMELQHLMGIEGIDLNPQEELPFLLSMDQPTRMQRYQVMRTRYAKRTQNLTPLVPQLPQQPQYGQVPQQAVQQQPQVPGAAPGQQSVLHRYQEQQAQPAGTGQREAPLSQQEREAVFAELCQIRDQQKRVPTDQDYQEAVRAVRYGRRYQGGNEPVY